MGTSTAATVRQCRRSYRSNCVDVSTTVDADPFIAFPGPTPAALLWACPLGPA